MWAKLAVFFATYAILLLAGRGSIVGLGDYCWLGDNGRSSDSEHRPKDKRHRAYTKCFAPR